MHVSVYALLWIIHFFVFDFSSLFYVLYVINLEHLNTDTLSSLPEKFGLFPLHKFFEIYRMMRARKFSEYLREFTSRQSMTDWLDFVKNVRCSY